MSVLNTSTKSLPAQLLRIHDLPGRARLIVQQAAESFPDAAVALYVKEAPESSWKLVASIGDTHVQPGAVLPSPYRLSELGTVLEPLLLCDEQLAPEDYAHLQASRKPQCWAALPLLSGGELVGALEIVCFSRAIIRTTLLALAESLEDAGPAIAHPFRYEQERDHYLTAITRIHELYELEKVFNSTMEMEALFEMVPSKFRGILQVRAVNLWMVKDEEKLVLVSRAGDDSTLAIGSVQQKTQGLVSQVSNSGEGKIIDDPDDPYLKQRNAAHARKIFSMMASPLMARGEQVGVIEAVDKQDGTPFNEDDLFLLSSVAETAGQALNNASLLHAERKVQILQTLVKVSTELASTLNLDRLLQALIHLPGAVIQYERASVAIEQRGRFQLKAVSGMTRFHSEDASIKRLTQMLKWASTAADVILITQHGNVISNSHEEGTGVRFKQYFEETSMRAFCAVPLADSEGRLGVLCFESSDPDFITATPLEMVRVLGAQATVALRNASLYKEVPFISVLEPLRQRKHKFLAMEKRLKVIWSAAAVFIAICLVGFPLPMRVEGDATLAGAHTAQIQPMIDGTIRSVQVREGQRVNAGDVIAEMEDWDTRSALASAQAKSAIAESEADRALSGNDGSAAGVQRAQADFWSAEVERARQRLEKTRLRAPFDGWVTTPHIEDFAGRHLSAGDSFAEVVDTSVAKVDIAVDDTDVLLVRSGSHAVVKLDGLPTRTFGGKVITVSPKSIVDGDKRAFFARVALPNPDGVLRPGMQGRAKISVGWHPMGYILFRRPALWAYAKLWSWISL